EKGARPPSGSSKAPRLRQEYPDTQNTIPRHRLKVAGDRQTETLSASNDPCAAGVRPTGGNLVARINLSPPCSGSARSCATGLLLAAREPPERFDRLVVEFHHHRRIALDTVEHRGARALAPLAASVKGFFACLPVVHAREGSHQQPGIIVMTRRAERDHIDPRALEHGGSARVEQPTKPLVHAGLQVVRADLEDSGFGNLRFLRQADCSCRCETSNCHDAHHQRPDHRMPSVHNAGKYRLSLPKTGRNRTSTAIGRRGFLLLPHRA